MRCPHILGTFEYLVSSLWHCVGRIRRYGLDGRGVSLGRETGFVILFALFPDCCLRYKLSVLFMPTAMMVVGLLS